MFRTVAVKGSAVGLLLVGVVIGAAGAQVVGATQLSRLIVTGPFTVLDGETANFHVARDSRSSTAPATVRLRLFDSRGTVVGRTVVTLAPGQSATLTHGVAGRFHGEVEVFESAPGEAGFVESTLEVGPANDLTIQPRFVCSAGENLPTGRQ
jgi:hypothetical protein